MNRFPDDTAVADRMTLDPEKKAILDVIAASRDASVLPLAPPMPNWLPTYSRDPTSALASLTGPGPARADGAAAARDHVLCEHG